MPGFDTLLICASPRSGSTLLCNLLAASGVAGRPESYFRRQDLDEYAEEWRLSRDAEGRFAFADYLAAARKASRTPNGISAIRLMGSTLPELLAALAGLWPGPRADLLTRAFGRLRYLHLSRTDRVAQAVSRLRAEQTGLWHRIGSWEERNPAAPGTPRYDPQAIAGFIAEARAEAAIWDDWFARHAIAPIRLTYEDLARDPVSEAARVLAELDLALPPGQRLDFGNERLADRTNAEWIARFRAETADPG